LVTFVVNKEVYIYHSDVTSAKKLICVCR